MALSDIFDDLEPAERVSLLEQASEECFDDGTKILQEGQANPSIFVIVDGDVAVRKRDQDGNGIEVACLGLGAIFGEMAFLTRDTASADVVAVGPVKVLRLGHEHIQQMVRRAPDFAGRFYRSVAITLAERLRETSRKL